MDLQLNGRACIVTGASIGIGVGIAKVLAREGACVALVARRLDLLEKVAAEIFEQTGTRPLIIAEDLTTADGPQNVINKAIEAFGQVDVLINNAGASMPVESGTSDEIEAVWDKSFALNFTAIRRLTDAALPSMKANGWGRIINVTGYMEPRHLNAAYSAKAAVNVWSKGLSCVVAKEGITINCIAPGLIRSEQIMDRLMPDDTARQEFIDANIPTGRLGEPEDIGQVVTFLASPLARLVTGVLLPVDDGMHYFAG